MKLFFKHMGAIALLLCSIAVQPISAQYIDSDSGQDSGSYTKLMLGASAVAVGIGLYWWYTSQPNSKPTQTEAQQPEVKPTERLVSHEQNPVIQVPHSNTIVEDSLEELQGLQIDEFEVVADIPRIVDLGQNPVISKEKIQEYLESPLHSYCTLDDLDVYTKIDRGRKKLHEIINGSLKMNTILFELEQTHADRHTHLENIVSICWYLYAIAATKDQAFDEGTFIVHDNNTLYDYLLQYVKNVNPQWNSCVSQSSNPYGYCRHSTHLKECQAQGNHHFGIDIRFGDSLDWWDYWVPCAKQQQALLPAGKRHILFGKVDDERTFIKMENDGLYRYDGWAQHAAGAIGSVARKLGLGSNDLNSYRKEHMPAYIQREIKQLVQQHNCVIETPKSIGSIFTAAEQHTELNAFATKLRQEYDHVEKRFGNEVILTPTELTAKLPDTFI